MFARVFCWRCFGSVTIGVLLSVDIVTDVIGRCCRSREANFRFYGLGDPVRQQIARNGIDPNGFRCGTQLAYLSL